MSFIVHLNSKAEKTRSIPGLMFYAVIALLVALPVLTLIGGTCSAAENPPAKGKVVVLLLDDVGALDFPSEYTPFCRRLASEWSSALMVTGSEDRQLAKKPETGGDYVSLGSGNRARGAYDAQLAFNTGEQFTVGKTTTTAGELYKQYTGYTAPSNAVVCLAWQEVRRNNLETGSKNSVGLLGTLLGKHGHGVAVLGNEDSYLYPRRFAPLICCDSEGIVPLGNVSLDTVEPASKETGGFQVNTGRTIEETRRFLAGADLLVVDTGDLGRLDMDSRFSGKQALAEERHLALKRIDGLASEIYRMLDPESSLLLIVSPSAPYEARKEGNYLTPFIAAGKGFGRGFLTSASTRRPGLINNTDFLPTILDFFEIAVPGRVVGSRVSTQKAGSSVDYLEEMYAQFNVTRKARWPLVSIYVLIVMAVVALSLACYLAGIDRLRWPRRPGLLARYLSLFAVALLATPLSFLAASAFSYRGYVFPVVFCLLFSVVVGLGSWFAFKGRRPDPVVFICMLTVAVQVVDLFFGGRLLLLPLLGVSSLEGMRFFGIPNTFAGIMIAVTVWATAGLVGRRSSTPEASPKIVAQKYRLMVAAAALLAVSFIIGFGGLGANLGGFIAAAVTFLVFFVAMSDRGFTKWRAAAIACATAFGAAFVVLMDVVFFHSHSGKAVSGGAARVLPILGRKVAIQVGQIEYFFVPALLLIIAAVAFALLIRRHSPFWAERWERNRPRMAALLSTVVGGLVGLVFNDTGITMLGLMMLVSALALAYYVMAQMSNREAIT